MFLCMLIFLYIFLLLKKNVLDNICPVSPRAFFFYNIFLIVMWCPNFFFVFFTKNTQNIIYQGVKINSILAWNQRVTLNSTTPNVKDGGKYTRHVYNLVFCLFFVTTCEVDIIIFFVMFTHSASFPYPYESIFSFQFHKIVSATY